MVPLINPFGKFNDAPDLEFNYLKEIRECFKGVPTQNWKHASVLSLVLEIGRNGGLGSTYYSAQLKETLTEITCSDVS